MNRKVFYDEIRQTLFGHPMTQEQVTRIGDILDAWDATDHTDLRWLAYALATAMEETMAFTQLRELGGVDYFTRLYDIRGNRRKALDLGNTEPGDGARFAGRGFDMMTGRENYAKESDLCGIDLIANPDKAMDPRLAADRLLRNMVSGLYRKHKLADYFSDHTADWVHARNIINGGLDQADLIAGYAQKFFKALQLMEVADPPPMRSTDQYSVVTTTGGEVLGMVEDTTAPPVAVAPEPIAAPTPVADPMPEQPAPAWHSGWKTHAYMAGCVALGIAGMLGYVPGMTADASAQLIEQGLAVSGIRSALPGIVNLALNAYLKVKT